ncbi:hypothetical protein PYCCODRAFT_1464228 [Trametes coccinea BRFM310]|uniref:IPT/TIG domain-containing protein n=1 Tax=Trametes coccinea (strain BRFM310) TaxID=1353009 RepID=A0A1Y2J154_TRAC3|nr:hypothetical protein PYCCODRAFT_1464228 [Trametes coccinea BRFM310]
MSSSSTTACSRSPSPSPTTPEASDTLGPIMNQEDLSAWRNSLPDADFLINGDIKFGDHGRKGEDGAPLDLEELLQDHVYEDVTPAAQQGPMFCPVTSPASSPNVPTMVAGARNTLSITKPIPPPAQVRKEPPALQRVVFPPKDSCTNLPILFPSLPEGGTKSRVETQIRLTVDLAHASSSSGEPFKYDKVGSWKWLRLPKGTSTKKRTRKEGKVDAASEDTLYLTADITCATPPHTRVSACSSCQAREAKRVARKIAARVRPVRSDSDSQEEPRIIPGKGRHEDTSNILQFNCPEVLDFSSGTVILPLRITCYCRHHREKVGFNLHFTMLDHMGRVVGTGTTKPIMITDDHKSTGVSAQKAGSEFGSKLDWTVGGTDGQEGGATKRKKGQAVNGADRSKKRAKPYDSNNRVSKLHRQSSSGSLQSPSDITSAFVTRSSSPMQSTLTQASQSNASTPPPMAFGFNRQSPSAASSGAPTEVMESASTTAVASPLLPSFDMTAPLSDFINTNFNADIPMPDSADMGSPAVPFPDPASSPFMQNHGQPQAQSMLDAMNLAVPSAAPAMPYMLFKHDPPPPISLPPPRIHRLIPSSGPTYGGIEVTVLGANFHPSMQLNCVFGGTVSTSTQRWSDNTLVCVLPPSTTPGTVHVWFEGMPKEDDGTPPCMFTYTDETDRALMELALQVVGLKMTGKIEDARNIAMRIVGNTGGPEPDQGMSAGGAMQLSSQADLPRHLLLGSAGDSGDFEKLLMDFLSVLDTPIDGPSGSLPSSISRPTASGQTLLHLATLAKFPALVKFLLERDIDIDARDQNGCTALFLAALTDSGDCARALVDGGAALDVVNAAGKTPAEVGSSSFFDFMASESERSSEDGHDSLEDEGAWADVDEESESEMEMRPSRTKTVRRASRRMTQRPSTTKTDIEQTDNDARPSSIAAEKKAVEAGLAAADEKQAAATFTETLYRTLAQLQNPQGMIPNLPLLHMPHLPGMPAWGALPQIPAVFPVLVPIQQLWGDRRGRGAVDKVDGAAAVGDAADANGQQPWLGIPSAQDWKAFWEKWMQQANRATEVHDNPPPAYTPREADIEVPAEKEALKQEPQEPVAGPAVPVQSAADPEPRVGVERVVARPVEYPDLPIPEEEVQLYGYRPTRKPARRAQKKHDRMLILFWIPILMIGFAWAFLQAVRIALHATRAVVTLKVGMRA